jgi:hypothetical protein
MLDIALGGDFSSVRFSFLNPSAFASVPIVWELRQRNMSSCIENIISVAIEPLAMMVRFFAE